jgi:hypothetical protein
MKPDERIHAIDLIGALAIVLTIVAAFVYAIVWIWRHA